MHKETHGFLYGMVAALTSGAMAVLVKFAASVPTETLVFARCIISFCLLLPLSRGKIEFHLSALPHHLFRAGAGLAALYCYFYTVKYLPLVNAISLSNTTPLFMPLLVFIWMKIIVSRRRLLALCVGFAGVLCILRPSPERFFNLASWVGLATGFFSAIAFLGIRQLSKKTTTETILFYYFAISILVSFFPMYAAWEPIGDIRIWMALGAMGILSALYQYTTTLSLTHAPASKVTAATYLNVVVSAWAGWWLFGEVPSLWSVVGTVLVIVGGILLVIDKEPSKRWK